MSSIHSVGGAAAVLAGAKPVAREVADAPFAGVFKGLVSETTHLSGKAQEAVTGLLSGSGVDVHEAMIATQKADIAFELALQVRNKAVGAYQQMLGMQF